MLQASWDWLQAHAWVVEVFLVVLGTLVARFLVKIVLDRLERRFSRSENLYDNALLEAGRKPLGWVIWVVGISWAAQIVAGYTESELFDYVASARQLALIALLTLFAVRFIRVMEVRLGERGESNIDVTTASAIGKLLRASVIITAVLIALQTMGFSISAVIAFGGVGGIAVGFAARDLLANIFGAMMVFLDRPFSVGDWIRSPDREIEGTVEDIGWRQTRIRTFALRPLYVPNAVFSTISVENPSRMLNRRIFETIGVRYTDVSALPAILADVREMLEQHEDIDRSRTLMVNFDTFGDSSLDFFVYTFTRTVVWTEYHRIKEDVLLRITEIIASHGAEVALPARRLHLSAAEANRGVAGEPETESESQPEARHAGRS